MVSARCPFVPPMEWGKLLPRHFLLESYFRGGGHCPMRTRSMHTPGREVENLFRFPAIAIPPKWEKIPKDNGQGSKLTKYRK